MKCANKNEYISFSDDRVIANFPDFDVEKFLITLEEWMISLLQNEESHGNISKLRYCYWCVSTIRSTLNKYETMEYEKIRNNVITVSEHLQKVLSSVGYMDYNNDSSSTSKCVNDICIHSPIPRKFSSNKRKIRRKCRPHKRTKDNESVKELYSSSKQYELDFQYLIDQLYIQTRTVLADNCLDDVHILKELGGYIDKTITAKDEINSRTILATDNLLSDHDRKIQTQLWYGDCKINGDSRDSFSDTFDNILVSCNSEIDLGSQNEVLLPRYKKSSVGSNRSRLKRDSDFDEGFSENEYIDDVGSGISLHKISEPTNTVCRQYCGDCDYNSSNSKLYEHRSLDGRQNDDGSDSDGGTEILNSVNATVNKFNAIMQNNIIDPVSATGHHKNPSVFTNVDDYSGRIWPTTIDLSLSPKKLPPEHIVETPLMFVPSSYREERIESPQIHYQHSQHLTNLANINGEPLSKMALSPISIQNWCSFNCNYLPSRSLNYYSKNAKNFDTTNTATENYDIRKLTPWLPCLSNNVPGNNCYHIPTNHRQHHQQQQQQQLHQILLPSINLSSMQHNMVHLPQIFHQSQHSAFDSEYLDRRYPPINQKLLSGANMNDSGNSDSLAPLTPITVVTNSNNHSNVSVSKNNFCQTIFKASLDKSQRACCFYMRGGCKKEDCEYAHDLSKVTCKFWEKGDCFKSDTCPFKHGYHKE